MTAHRYIAAFLLLVLKCSSVHLRSISNMSQQFMLDAPNCSEVYPGKCAPYAVILGADKCGTNAVAAYLEAMGLSKQTAEGCRRQYAARGWCGEVNWDFQTKPLNSLDLKKDYGVNFPDTDWKSSAAFDKSTVYFRQAAQPGFIDNFKAALPNSKLIAVLCDPVDRVWSRMQMLRETSGIRSDSKCPWNVQEKLTDTTANQILNQTKYLVEQIDKGLTDDQIHECKACQLLCMVLRTGDYAPHIKAWSNAYGLNFQYFISEDIQSNPDRFIHEMSDFLKYVGAAPRYRVRDVGAVHSRVNDPTYWNKEGVLWNGLRELLAPRYQWDNVVSQRAISGTPPQVFDRVGGSVM